VSDLVAHVVAVGDAAFIGFLSFAPIGAVGLTLLMTLHHALGGDPEY
jgi:hypothetical protein